MKQITITRRKVATTANRLKKMGLTLSEAFKKAWSIIKGRVITTKVRGVTFGIGQKALEHLTHYANEEIIISLNREVANLYDSNAIEVYAGVVNKGNVKIGYLPAQLSKIIAPLIDLGFSVKSCIKEIRGKYMPYMNLGIEIELYI